MRTPKVPKKVRTVKRRLFSDFSGFVTRYATTLNPKGRGLWNREVECQTPARSTSPNSCSTGLALWEFFRKKVPYYRAKAPDAQGKRRPKDRYCFSCLKVSPPSKFGGGGLWMAGEIPTLAAAATHRGKPQKGLSPEFRATRLWRGLKKGPLWRFSAYFPVFKAKKGPRKICAKPWLPVIRA